MNIQEKMNIFQIEQTAAVIAGALFTNELSKSRDRLTTDDIVKRSVDVALKIHKETVSRVGSISNGYD